MRNELKVSVPRGTGGSPSQSRIGRQKQNPGPQLSAQRLGVDHAVHDANSAGQVLDGWQLVSDAVDSRMASGSLASAARSIAGVGSTTATSTNNDASSAVAATCVDNRSGAVGSGVD